MSPRSIAVAAALMLAVTACGGGADDDVAEDVVDDGADAEQPDAAQAPSDTADEPAATRATDSTGATDATAPSDAPVDDGSPESTVASAERIPPSVDVNACSALGDDDLTALGVQPAARRAAVNGFDAATLGVFPRCEFLDDDLSSGFELEIGPADRFGGGDVDAGVGDRSSFDADVTGDVELQFTAGDLWYRVVADDLGDDATARSALVDFAERAIANRDDMSAFMGDLATAAEVIGGPDVAPCEAIDADAIAAGLGIAAYVVHPTEEYRGSTPNVGCTVAGGVFDYVVVSFTTLFDTGCADPVETTEVAGAPTCAGPGTVGIGTEAVADFGDHRVVASTDREPVGDAAPILFDALDDAVS